MAFRQHLVNSLCHPADRGHSIRLTRLADGTD
jgi:hypothetical protein